MTDDAELTPGSTFAGRFEIVRPLGEGAFGAVFEARMHPMMRRCALKVLHADAVGNAKVAARFLREARILGEFEHPHVVSVLDVGLHDGPPYIAMELLQGETLAARVRQGALPLSEALAVLLPVCSALVAVHERDIVHRDLKPENIMLARQATGQVVPKILDFGIAKADLRDGEATRSRAIMGTPFYMSPEQAVDSKNIDARSDQWALGVIAWELLAGRRPFTGPHQIAVLNAVISGVVPSLRAASPEVPPSLEAVITRMLSRDPAGRFGSVQEAACALLPFADIPTQAQWSTVFGAGSPASPVIDPSAMQVASTPRAPAMGTVQAPPPVDASGLSFSSRTVPPASHTQPEAPAAPRKRGGILMGAAALGLLLAGVGVAVSLRGSPTAEVSPATQVQASFAVRVIAEPSSATLRLDDTAPTRGSLQVNLPRDGRPHTLVVRAEGFAPESLHFTDVPPPGRVTLHPLPAAAALPPVAPTPAVAPAVPAPIAPTVIARTSPTAPTPAAARPASRGRRREPGVESSPLIHAPAPSGGSCPNGQCVF